MRPRSDSRTTRRSTTTAMLWFCWRLSLGGFGELDERAVHERADEALLARVGEEVAELALAAAHERREDLDLRALGPDEDVVGDLRRALALDGAAAVGAVRRAGAREEQAEVVVDLGDRADGGARVVAGALLLDGDRGGEPLDRVDVGLLHEPEELPGVGGERLDVAALPFGVDRVEGERALAGAGESRDDREAVAGDLDVDVPEIVLAGAADDQPFFGHSLVSWASEGAKTSGPDRAETLACGALGRLWARACDSPARVRSPCSPSPPPAMPQTEALVIMTTVANANEAARLVRELLERRLIACGTILPGVRSLYRWDARIADESEVVVLLKTHAARLDAIEVAFGELHPYKLPELLALPVAAGLPKYLDWIADETAIVGR